MRGLFNPSLCIPVVVYQDGGDNVTGNGVRGNGVRRLGLSVAAGIRPQRSGGRSPVPTGVGGVLASATRLRHVRASDRAILCNPPNQHADRHHAFRDRHAFPDRVDDPTRRDAPPPGSWLGPRGDLPTRLTRLASHPPSIPPPYPP